MKPKKLLISLILLGFLSQSFAEGSTDVSVPATSPMKYCCATVPYGAVSWGNFNAGTSQTVATCPTGYVQVATNFDGANFGRSFPGSNLLFCVQLSTQCAWVPVGTATITVMTTVITCASSSICSWWGQQTSVPCSPQ